MATQNLFDILRAGSQTAHVSSWCATSACERFLVGGPPHRSELLFWEETGQIQKHVDAPCPGFDLISVMDLPIEASGSSDTDPRRKPET